MSSCEVREEDRARTLASLQRFGIHPRVFLSPCNPAGARLNRENGLRALTWTQGNDALFLEDDIDLAPDFADFLDLARDFDHLTWLYINDNPANAIGLYGAWLWREIENRKPIPPCLVKPGSYNGLWGAQCVYIPERHVAGILAFDEPFAGAFDDLVKTYAEHAKIPVRIALPSPVQHRHSRVGRAADDHPKRSLTFDLERA